MKIKMEKLQKIEREPIMVEFSDEAVEEYNDLLERNALADGLTTDDVAVCRCPRCGTPFQRNVFFCTVCGQKVRFVNNDVVPL